MKKRTGTFASSNGRDRIRYYVYSPEESPRAILQISHGMCEYLTRYEGFMEYMADKGFLVCGNDHLGHGGSAASKEELGYFASENGWSCLVEDLHRLTVHMKKKYPYLPYYLLGHSMGSFVARAYLVRYGDALDGAILCGTSGSNPFAALGVLMAKMLARVKGDHYRSRFLNDLMFQSYNSRYPKKRTSFDWLTREETIVDRYIQDPYCNFVFTANGFENLLSMLRYVSSSRWYASVPRDLPILLISGDMDPVGQYGSGVKQVFRRLKKEGVVDLTIRLYEQGRHELLNETNRLDIYSDVVDWLEG
ncbi:alpha/beta fold hydrolase [Bianquea renquensis]|jgi:hypothetical protein|uniref:Lysophospholipase n=1 Tax=Bianquea renquensis TaxID=2763661 RepID=A0A926DQ39_9FIRM|nr:alpha/beta fold hydrolase [Bianquea renquensis]MBC8543128.1 lysophospholipase [Bianquea renquensis]